MRRIDRRDLLICACGPLIMPLASFAQQTGKVRHIGFLSLDSPDSEIGLATRTLFPEALKQLGYVEGDNLVIDWRWGNGRPADLPGLAAALVQSKVELIVARNNGSIAAAIQATKSIPIVMFSGNYPVDVGFIKSFAHPGGNVTGTSFLPSADMSAKQLQLLQELVPAARRIAVLRNANTIGTVFGDVVYGSVGRTATRLGMSVQYFDVYASDEVGAALEAIVTTGISTMWYGGDPIFRARTAEIMAFLGTHRIAAIATIPTFAEAGGLAHYAPDGRDSFFRSAIYVDRILKGTSPSELPVEGPTKYEFAINLKTANLLGIKVPRSLLARATKVID